MNFEQELSNSSRVLADMLAEAVCEQPELLAKAIAYSQNAKKPYPMRISRVVWIVFEQNPALLTKHLKEIYRITFSTTDESVRRNYLGILRGTMDAYNEEELSHMLDTCLHWLQSAFQPVAVKGQAVKILEQIGKKYPELIPEIVGTIESQLDEASTGLKAVSRNTIRALTKL